MKLRLTLDVTYSPNGVEESELVRRLEHVVQIATGDGLLTGETEAEVDEYSFNVENLLQKQHEVQASLTADRGSFKAAFILNNVSYLVTMTKLTTCHWTCYFGRHRSETHFISKSCDFREAIQELEQAFFEEYECKLHLLCKADNES